LSVKIDADQNSCLDFKVQFRTFENNNSTGKTIVIWGS